MSIHFLFPSHPIRTRLVEEMFEDQYSALQAAGYSASLCPDGVIQEGKPLRDLPDGVTVVYRGWMFNANEYEAMVQAVIAAGGEVMISTEVYLSTHHLPNWYPLVVKYTPETVVFSLDSDWQAELTSLGWESFFIKDYVKSLKTSVGSIIQDPSQIGPVVEEMIRFRGEVEGGLCVRRVEAFQPETERRYYVLDGHAYAPDGGAIPHVVEHAANVIPSAFFSVDVVLREDGVERIVEIGDGQVSDLVGWTVDGFVGMWRERRPS